MPNRRVVRRGLLRLAGVGLREGDIRQRKQFHGVEVGRPLIPRLGLLPVPHVVVLVADVVGRPRVVRIEPQDVLVRGNRRPSIPIDAIGVRGLHQVAFPIRQPVPMAVRRFDRPDLVGEVARTVAQLDGQLAPRHGERGIDLDRLFEQTDSPGPVSFHLDDMNRL